jgi:DNA-binding CsgD family transcriptional regulator
MRRRSAQDLLERDDELDAVRVLSGATRDGDGAIVVIEGPAGAGKTSLLAGAVEIARSDGLSVGRARGSELEYDFPFGVVGQLYEPLLAELGANDRAELFTGAAEVARPLLDPDARRDASALDPHGVLHGLYWLTVNLAGQAPLLLAVDDFQWSDSSSRRFVAYLANRIEGIPVLLVVGTRPAENDEDATVLDELIASPLTTTLWPAPLSVDAVGALVTEGLGTTEAQFSAACASVTHGNPLLVHELVSALATAGVEPTVADAPRVAEVAPGSATRWVARWLRRLPAAATRVARALAVLGDRTDLATVAALAELDITAAVDSITALQRVDIIDPDALAFCHPVVRSAVYADVPSHERAALHRSAATILMGQGADDRDIALHLRHATPSGDTAAVATLRRAAHRAFLDGAADEARGHLARALGEPPAPAERSAVLVELARADLADARLSGLDHLREAVVATSDRVAQARVGLELGQALSAWAMFGEAANVLARVAEDLGDADPSLTQQLTAAALMARLPDPTLLSQADEAHLLELFAHNESVRDSQLLSAVAVAASVRLPPAAAAVPLVERALTDPDLSFESHPLELAFLSFALVHAGAFDQALQIWDGVMTDARSRGSLASLGFADTLRSLVLLRVGDVARAESAMRYRLGTLTDRSASQLDGQPFSVMPFVLLALTDALVERGELEDASVLLDQHGLSGPLPNLFGLNHLLEARGRLRLAQGRTAEGIADIRECGTRCIAAGYTNPAVISWRSSLAVALAAGRQHDEAFRLASEELDLAREFQVRREMGMALRARGLAEGGERGIASLREATAVLESSPARLEHARALTDLGAALRRRGQHQAARDPLRTAVDTAQRCGARALASRAHTELVAAGAKPRRLVVTGVAALTASERRVTDLAADGLANRDIAQALFVTEKTVESHLSHAYTKLNVKSRSQLPDALGERADVAVV